MGIMKENIINILNFLEEIKASKKSNEEICVDIQTIYNEFYSPEISNLWNYPEDRQIQFKISSEYKTLEYDAIKLISHRVFRTDFD